MCLDGPVDVPVSLEFFRRSGDDLIDRFDGRTFVRVLRVGSAVHSAGAVVMTPAGDVEHPRLHVRAHWGDAAAVAQQLALAAAVSGSA